MGGMIKISLKENNKITTVETHTACLNGKYGSLKDLFTTLTEEDFLNDPDCCSADDLLPSCYGHLFINRDDKEIFNLNDYNDLNVISFSFIKNRLEEYKENQENEEYKELNNDYIYRIKNNIAASDNIFIIDKNKNIVKDLSDIKEPLVLMETFFKETENNENKRSYKLLFENKNWKIIDYSVDKESLLKFKNYLLSLNLELDEEEFYVLLSDYS